MRATRLPAFGGALLLAAFGCRSKPTAQASPASSATPRQIHIDGKPVPCADPSCAPLYVIDGVPLDPARVPVVDTSSDATKRFKPLQPSEIDSISVMRGEEAIRRFGDAARNGVIFVWTKRLRRPTPTAAGDTNPPPGQQTARAPDTTALSRHVGSVAVEPTGPRVSCDSGCRHARPPLFVIDGAVVGRATPPTLERRFIDTVIVLRGAKATARYGAAGRDGVVQIRMLRRDTLPVASTSPATPLPLRQAAAFCGYMAGRAPVTVIDGFMLPGVAATEWKWPELRWSEVLRRDRYSPDEAMAEFGMRGRWGAVVYTTIYADSADSLHRRRPPGTGIHMRGVASLAPSDTEPLLIVNGTPVAASDSALQSLDPNDIEAIDLYKCPDAVAAYGRRARGGAIVVTLKAGAVFPRPATKP